MKRSNEDIILESLLRNLPQCPSVSFTDDVMRRVAQTPRPAGMSAALWLKQLDEDPWAANIPGKYAPGQVVTGTVTKITNFGVFVGLEDGLEGLLHISELADHKVENPEDVVKVGDKIEVKVLHGAAGPISESDVLLASASDAVVIGFNVKVESSAVAIAKRENVQVKLYSIIYELMDQVKEAMLGKLDPLTREKVVGHAKVKQVFRLTRGVVAGCVVTDGRLDRKARARVIRGTQPVFDGHMDTLRRFHDEVPEVRNGLECGVRLANYTEYEEEDVIECYELEKIAQSL